MTRAVRQRGRTAEWAWRVGVAAGTALAVACGGSATSAPRDPTTSVPSPASGPAARGSFRHHRSGVVVRAGAPHHRGRDVLVAEPDAQELEAKLAYGPIDKDLEDEDVEVLLVREGEPAVALGTVRTSRDGEGDDGGRARLRLEGAARLPLGRHRVRFVVRGDGTSAEIAVVVVPSGTPAFVSDVDGTLTSSEWAELPAALTARLPAPHPGAARALTALAERGVLPVYVTARPEWLVPRTRRFLAENAFPPGVVVTKKDKSGAFGAQAAAYKKAELERIARVVRLTWAFGNMPSDAEVYAALVTDPRRRVLYRFTDAAHGGRRIESYDEIFAEVSRTP